jgi:hypothetical protein
MGDRADVTGTIEYARQQLAFLKTLSNPSAWVSAEIMRLSEEVAANEPDRTGRLFQVNVRDAEGIYDLAEFRIEIEAMFERYYAPLSVEGIRVIEDHVPATLDESEVEAAGGRSSPTGSPLSPSDFHDVAGANL